MEYKVVYADPGLIAATLDKYAEDRWRVIAFLGRDEEGAYMFLIQREL